MKKANIFRLSVIPFLVTVFLFSSLSAGMVSAAAPQAPHLFSNQVFRDDFNGSSVNGSNWGYEIGKIRNNEAQYYRSQNATVANGWLTITAKRENYSGSSYTSASLTSQNKKSFKYGYFEMRGNINTNSGLWPAWWGIGTNAGGPPSYSGWPHSGEIDMMEYYRGAMKANIMDSLAHWTSHSSSWSSTSTHYWGMYWDANNIYLYRDGATQLSYSVANANNGSYNPFHNPFFFFMNLAVGGSQGGDPSGTTFPRFYNVDYMYVLQ